MARMLSTDPLIAVERKLAPVAEANHSIAVLRVAVDPLPVVVVTTT
jgi:hypothetical protein